MHMRSLEPLHGVQPAETPADDHDFMHSHASNNVPYITYNSKLAALTL